MQIRMTLCSDAVPGNGEGLAGIIDSDISYDDYGIPFIPSKRIKGILRESALELSNAGVITENAVQDIFGRGYMKKGSDFRISNGYLEGYHGTPQKLDKLTEKNKAFAQMFHAQNVIECFTRLRSQTAVTDKGVFKTGSLRTCRVLNKGHVFIFDVQIPESHVGSFKTICRVTRSFGVSRTRGFGEVRLELLETKDETKTAPITGECPNDEICSIELAIANEAELLVSNKVGSTQETERYIPGSFIMGAFAGLYINGRGLSVPHEDAVFRKLFLDGEAAFSNAYPIIENEPSIPCPLSIVKEKDRENIFDISNEEGLRAVIREDTQTKGVPAAFVSITGNELKAAETDISIAYHHRRPDDKSKGRAVESGSEGESDGIFFQFEVISPGQRFKSSITGKFSILKELMPMLSERMTLYLGKSRTAQYGKCTVEVSRPVPVKEKKAIAAGDEFWITLASDSIVLNENGFPSADTEDLVRELNDATGFNLELSRAFSRTDLVGGFMGVWKLPKVQTPALKAGTVLRVNNKSGKDIDAGMIESRSWGIRTPEGFGKVLVNIHGGSTSLEKADAGVPGYVELAETGLYTRIIKDVALKELKTILSLNGSKTGKKTGLPSSFISRVSALIASSSNSLMLNDRLSCFAGKKAGEHCEKLKGNKGLFIKISGSTIGLDEESFMATLHNLSAAAHLNKLMDDFNDAILKENLFELYKYYAAACLSRMKHLERSK